MIHKSILTAVGLLTASIFPTSVAAASRFTIEDGNFMLDGAPYVIKAAELHYPRIPEPYWEHRIKMCKALGMNTICLYVFWNIHEQTPDEFDFTGQNDLRRFVELCRDNGMNVILRPGPYVCAEWEMGGLPWWLLRHENIRLRENDPYFLERVDKFQQKVAEQVADLTADNGGPILMIQVENEYGSYATDKEYMSNIRDIVRKNFGEDVTLFQCDWSSNFLNNGLDDLIWTINFGTGADIDSQFAPLREARPDSPLMCSEYWSGWFDKWGAMHETRPAEEMTAGIDEMLSKGISFSLYMTHGGTNRGHWAGANSPGFAPDVTSYDYDAPINEAGHPTPKYYLLRETLAKYMNGIPQDSVPEPPAVISIPKFTLTEVAPLQDNLPQSVKDTYPHPMEDYGQGFGSILYRTSLPAINPGDTLIIEGLHDYGRIFADGRLLGVMDRRNGDSELILPALPAGSTLDILVEAMGRINFGRAISDYKGITGKVELHSREGKSGALSDDWTVYNLNDDYAFYNAMDFRPLMETSPAESTDRLPAGVYRGTFTLTDPGDTFLDFSSWGKGLVYVNGHPMGRIWNIGPQQTLYMPGCWLNSGENEIMVFDIIGPKEPAVEGKSMPVLDMLQADDISVSSAGIDILPDAADLLGAGSFNPGGGWKELRFPSARAARYICMEALSATDGGDQAAIAELYLVDGAGVDIPRENWRIIHADSQDAAGGNHTPDKIIDLQESTYWCSAAADAFPYRIVIDMGREYEVAGMRYLPRMEPTAPGAIGDFRIYGRSTPFWK